MKKLDLNKIVKDDVLIGNTVKHDIEFNHQGETYHTEVYLKSLSFSQTEPLYNRLANLKDDDSLIADWISQAVVDEKGKHFLTPDDVKQTFPQTLAMAVFNKVIGMDDVKRDEQGKPS